jgi:hypothetical protein
MKWGDVTLTEFNGDANHSKVGQSGSDVIGDSNSKNS